MLVTFRSSETGEIIMFADIARLLLTAIGKDCTARGTFTPAEMLPAAEALQRAVARSEQPTEEDEEASRAKGEEPQVGLSRRAWPLIDMLERTARRGERGHIVWEAAKDF